jgi:hypothetical protein
MKRNRVFISFSLIVLFSMLVGITASTAQILQPAGQSKVNSIVRGWKQVNNDGFGNPANSAILSLEIFNGQLYATSANWISGAQVWELQTDGSWTPVSEPGFGSAYGNINSAIPDMTVFNGNLYAGTAWSGTSGQIWRTPDVITWSPVITDGFGITNSVGITTFGIFDGILYAGVEDIDDGVEIWRSPTGDSGDWENVVTGGNGDLHNYTVTSFIAFGDYFYAAIENLSDGTEIWRTSDGSIWSPASSGGFGDPDNVQTGGMTIFGDYLYVGTRNDIAGAQLFRTADGITWDPVIEDGFGDVNNFKIEMISTWNSSLIAGTDNHITGIEIWQSSDGLVWKQVNPDGFGDSNNYNLLWNSSSIEYNHHLLIGTENAITGGEIWQYIENQLYLPLVGR